MTQKDFLSRLKTLAGVCDFQLNQDLVTLYDRALRRFGYDRATAAVEDAIMERRGQDRMPSIGDLVQRCAPSLADADLAVEVATRIIAAVPKFGGYASDADVSDWLGPVAMHVIQGLGGWQHFARTFGRVTDAKEVGIWKAQLREHAASTLRQHKAGVLGIAPRFGEVSSGQQRVAALIGSVLEKNEKYDGSTGNVRAVSPAFEPR